MPAMPRKLIDDPEFWRSRAEEVRVIADDLKEAEARAIMDRIANDYERLAIRAEHRRMRRRMSSDTLAMAELQGERGREIVVRQRELIARLHQRGIDAAESEGLLKRFEDSLVIFEEHLASMLLTAAPRQ
jgi:hypothetical protein